MQLFERGKNLGGKGQLEFFQWRVFTIFLGVGIVYIYSNKPEPKENTLIHKPQIPKTWTCDDPVTLYKFELGMNVLNEY